MTKFEDLESDAVLALGNIQGSANMSADTLATINEIKYDSFGEALQGIGRSLLMGVFEPFQQKVMPVVNEFAKWIASKMPVVEEITNQTFTKIFEVAENVWLFFKDNILPIFTEAYDKVNDYFPVIQKVAETVFKAVLDVVTTVWDFFKKSLLPIFESLYKWIQGHMPTIRKTAETVFNAIKSVVSGVWSFFKNNLLPILSNLFSWVQSKMPQIQRVIETVFKAVKNVVEVAWDIFTALIDVLKLLWDFIEPTFPAIGAIIDGAMSFVIDVIEGVITVFETVTEAIKDAVDWLMFWNDSDVEDKDVNVNTNYTSTGGVGGVPQYAKGTNFHPGGLALVGEKGAELVNLPRGSKVSTANETKQMLSGTSYGDVYVTISAKDVKEFNGVVDFFKRLPQAQKAR